MSRAERPAARDPGAGAIEVSWQAQPRLVPDARIAAAARAALEHGGRAGIGLSVVLVDEPTIAALHGRWLADPTPTDVIAFDLGEDSPGVAGELYASVPRARQVARERGHSPADELLLYVVHGALHLCGHDDREPLARAAMRAAERAVLARIGVDPGVADEPRPPPPARNPS